MSVNEKRALKVFLLPPSPTLIIIVERQKKVRSEKNSSWRRAQQKKLWKRFINSHTSFWSFFAAVFVIKADITLNSFSPLFHFLFFTLPSLGWRYHAPIFYLLYALMPLGNILAEIAETMRLTCSVMRALLTVISAATAIATLKLKVLESRFTRSLNLSVGRIGGAMTHKLLQCSVITPEAVIGFTGSKRKITIHLPQFLILDFLAKLQTSIKFPLALPRWNSLPFWFFPSSRNKQKVPAKSIAEIFSPLANSLSLAKYLYR